MLRWLLLVYCALSLTMLTAHQSASTKTNKGLKSERYQIPAPPAAPRTRVTRQPVNKARKMVKTDSRPTDSRQTNEVHETNKHRNTHKLHKFLHKQQTAQNRSKQLHDRERQLARLFLLYRLYYMMKEYMARHRNDGCHDNYIPLRVGYDSPVFGGVFVDTPRAYIKDFSISGYDESMSRAELYGCRNLPQGDTDYATTCGPGPATLLWSWYNGQNAVTLPDNTTVLCGHDTDIHFLVVRLIKFRSQSQGDVEAGRKLVRINFRDCASAGAYHASSYKFVVMKKLEFRRSVSAPKTVNIDISCKHTGPPFLIYGYAGQIGIFGQKIRGWKVNGTRTSIMTLERYNKIHKLKEPLPVNTGDVLQVRCEYKRTQRRHAVVTPYMSVMHHQQLCELRYLTLINSTLTPFSPSCKRESKFTQPDISLQYKPASLPHPLHWFSAHRYEVVLVFGVALALLYFLYMFGCRPGAESRRDQDREGDGLLDDYKDINMKVK